MEGPVEQRKSLTTFGLLLSISLVASTYLVTDALRDIKISHQIIKVRGYAETNVTSDYAVWKVTIKARNPDLGEAYNTMETQLASVQAFLQENSVADSSIDLSTVQVAERRKRDEKGNQTNQIDHFELSQEIEVSSENVTNISGLSTAIAQLLRNGVEVHSEAPRYYYSKVNDLKGQLLTKATRDAGARATTLAEGSGARLGALKAARQGVFGIHAATASSISSESANDDVSSIQKRVTAVVTVDYAMK